MLRLHAVPHSHRRALTTDIELRVTTEEGVRGQPADRGLLHVGGEVPVHVRWRFCGKVDALPDERKSLIRKSPDTLELPKCILIYLAKSYFKMSFTFFKHC